MITDGIRLTEARRKAVTGKNFIKNVNRFIENPEKTIKQYVKRRFKSALKQETEQALQNEIDKRNEVKRQAVFDALLKLEGKLKNIDKTIDLPMIIWDNVDKIQFEDVYQMLEYVEMDLYGDSGQQPSEHIFIDDSHKGYKQGMEQQDFLDMVENMLLHGFHSTPFNGIY